MDTTLPTPTTPRRTRDAARADTLRAIDDAARRQLAEVGAAGLSLRSVARELGMVSSGIYRYVASRDELLTRLITQAYGDLADAVEDAVATTTGPRRGPRHAWAAASRALRAWALEHPHEWALLYGSPVPGYAAPTQTVEPASRLYGPFAAAVPDAGRGSRRRVDPALRPDAERIAESFGLAHPEVGIRLLGGLGHLIGAVSLEVFGHLTGVVGESARDAHFEAQIEMAAAMLDL